MVPGHPVIYIDDSDIVKPEGHKFEALGWVRDGSESTAAKNVYQKGYHVTEATVLTSSHHPVSLFSEIHSSAEKNFTSINDITFSAMERASALFEKATFVMDRGYDDNKMFLKLDSMDQDYVIRLTAWNGHPHYLKKQPLSWTGVMMITRCSLSWIPWTRIM